jgi:hypothetical protein
LPSSRSAQALTGENIEKAVGTVHESIERENDTFVFEDYKRC